MFNFEAYDEYLALLRPIFSEGWERRAPPIGGWRLSRVWTDVATCLRSLGRERDALKVHESILLLDIGIDSGVAIQLINVTVSLLNLGQNYDACCVLQLVENTIAGSAMHYLCAFRSAVQRGDFELAGRFAAQLTALPRPTSRSIYRPGHYEFWSARLHFHTDRLDEATLANAEYIATKGNHRQIIRDLHRLRGEWQLSQQRYAEAANAFEEYIQMTQAVNLPTSDVEARLALTQAHLNRTQSARETADHLAQLEDPPHLELAELYLALNDPEKARHHILPAYKKAWADGEPYANWWPLQRSRKVLQALGDPEPQLPKFDPANYPPLPYEAKVLEYIEKKKAEREKH